MRTRLAVLAGALLVFSLSAVDNFATEIDRNAPDSPDVNIVWSQDNLDNVDLSDNIADRLDNSVDQDLSFDADNLDIDSPDNRDRNVVENRRDDNDQLVSDGADQFDSNVLSAADVNDTDNR